MNRVLKQRNKLHGKKRVNLKELDLTVFQHPKSECLRSPDDSPITERCAYTLRLCTASMYLEALRTSSKMKEDAKKALFTEFNEEVYRLVLDDTAHFTKERRRLGKCSFISPL